MSTGSPSHRVASLHFAYDISRSRNFYPRHRPALFSLPNHEFFSTCTARCDTFSFGQIVIKPFFFFLFLFFFFFCNNPCVPITIKPTTRLKVSRLFSVREPTLHRQRQSCHCLYSFFVNYSIYTTITPSERHRYHVLEYSHRRDLRTIVCTNRRSSAISDRNSNSNLLDSAATLARIFIFQSF